MQVILLEYPGVEGEVMLKDRLGVACNSISFDLSRKGDLGKASYGDKTGGRKFGSNSGSDDNLDDKNTDDDKGVDRVSISRTVDKASPTFMKLAYTTKTSEEKTATITVYRAFERSDITKGGAMSVATAITDSSMTSWHEPFMTITLKDVHVASHKINVSASDLNEDLEISFKEITFEYVVYKNGKKLGTTSGKVDISKGEPVTT